jgi:NADH-quinone oxidoreductase subunit G
LFLTETAAAADVVLPAQSWAERDGTFTNGERRVQRFYPAIPIVGDSRPDWQILAQLALRLGVRERVPFAAGLIFREITQAVPQYGEMSYRGLAEVVEQWPRVGGDDLYYGGTSYDNKSGVGLQWPSAAEASDAEIGQYTLPPASTSTGEDGIQAVEVRALYRPGSLIARTEILASRMAEPALWLSVDDAADLGVGDGDLVTVRLEGREVRLPAHLDGDLQRGVAVLQAVNLPPGRVDLEIVNVEKSNAREVALP